MRYRHPLKQILFETSSHWDQNQTPPRIRWAFGKAVQCQTPELGAEIYVGDDGELIVTHANRERARVAGIVRTCSGCANAGRPCWTGSTKGTFTMPDVLWPIFRDNRHLAWALSGLAASVIQAEASARCGSRVGVMAILHTFNGQLEFNSHVHTMVSGGHYPRTPALGLHGSITTVSS